MDLEGLSYYEKSGYLGSLLLIVGPFLPIACVPLFGCFNYIDGDGIFILGFGLISAYLVKEGKYKYLAGTGGLSLLIILSFWSDIMGEEMISTGIGLWAILVGSVLVCYTSWNAWDTSLAPTRAVTPLPPPTNSPSISHPPEIIPVAKPIATIECPGCAAQMKVPRLGKMQNITCDSCGVSGEINI